MSQMRIFIRGSRTWPARFVSQLRWTAEWRSLRLQPDHPRRNDRSHVLLSELLHCFPECAPRWWMRPDVPVPFWRYVFIDSGRCCPAVGGELVVCWFRGLDIAGIAFGDAAHSGFGPHRAGKRLRQCSLSAQGGDHQRGFRRSWRIIGQPCTSHGTQLP